MSLVMCVNKENVVLKGVIGDIMPFTPGPWNMAVLGKGVKKGHAYLLEFIIHIIKCTYNICIVLVQYKAGQCWQSGSYFGRLHYVGHIN